MEAQADNPAGPASVVVIKPGRASTTVLLGAVDAVLRSGLPRPSVRIALAADDSRRARLEALCGADARVELDAPSGARRDAGVAFEMPARARPQPHTLARVAALIREDGLARVDVPVPGRYAALARVAGHGRLRAYGEGSGSRTVRPGEVGLRSVASRGEPGPPQGTVAEERAEHLRHRARSATMRARMNRNTHRLSRERLQTRHERARERLAERRLGATGPGEWVRWRARAVGRRAAAAPSVATSGAKSLRSFGRRARRFAVDRWRSRSVEG